MKEQHEIMQKLLEELNMSANRFAKEIGLNIPNGIYNILNKKNGISKEMQDRILRRFTEINPLFLVRGSEPIFKTTEQNQTIQNIDSSVSLDKILVRINLLEKQNKELKSILQEVLDILKK